MELEAQTVQLMGTYRSIYTRLVRPDVSLPVRDYFLKNWAPHLGGDLSLLVIQLRRLCLAEDGHSVELSAAQLASLVGISERTLRRHLADPRLVPFVQRQHQWRYDASVGHGVQSHNRYVVGLDDPLTEKDEQLAKELAQDTDRLPRQDEDINSIVAERNTTERPLQPEQKNESVGSDEGKINKLIAGHIGQLTEKANIKQKEGRAGPVKLSDTIPKIMLDIQSIKGSKQKEILGEQTKHGPVDLLNERPDWYTRVEDAEGILGETGASRGFYVKVLRALEGAGAMNIWDRALGLAREQDPTTIRRSRGALFNVLVRQFAADAGVTI